MYFSARLVFVDDNLQHLNAPTNKLYNSNFYKPRRWRTGLDYSPRKR